MKHSISIEVSDLVIDLNDEELAAVEQDDWEYLWDLLCDKVAAHTMSWGVITDVRER